jgi:hypothetical protein
MNHALQSDIEAIKVRLSALERSHAPASLFLTQADINSIKSRLTYLEAKAAVRCARNNPE